MRGAGWEEFVAKHLRRRRILCSPKKRKLKLPTDRRALDDPSLQKGDVVATSRGLVVFVGSDGEEHQPGAFLPVPDPAFQRQRCLRACVRTISG
jgi:hypothetical protein